MTDDLRNISRARMSAGEPAIGVALRIGRTAEIVPALRSAGVDWLFLDLEHGPFSVDTASQIALIALQAGLTPIARVPKGEFSMATRLLDNGALGLVIPHVDNAEEAQLVVERLRLPPEGGRSVYGGMPHFDYAPRPVAETSRVLNRETLIVVMLETQEAMRNAAAIAAVPGVDVLFIGVNDFCADLGASGEFHHPAVAAAFATTIAACRAHGKWAGIGGLYDPALMARFIGDGVRFVLAGSDLGFLMQGAAAKTAELRAIRR